MIKLPKGLTDTQKLAYAFFKNPEGDPLLLTPGQDDIFKAITKREDPRVHVMCHTRYGKSMTVGVGVDLLASTFPVKVAIISGTKDKAKIIMDYVIGHIFDNDYTKYRLIPGKGESVQELQRYRNKNHINFRVDDPHNNYGTDKPLYGEVFIGSAKDALGFGASVVIEDEAALIPDTEHTLVMRMLGDDVWKNTLIKIGNPFERNHFLASFRDPRYKKIVIDHERSLEESEWLMKMGYEPRMTQQLIDEMSGLLFFDVLYGCRFPSNKKMDSSGWNYLFTDEDIMTAERRKVEVAGKRRLGHDVARGGRNFNVWVLRTDNYARILDRDHSNDLTKTGDKTINLAKEFGVDPADVYIDDTGVGGGEVDYLRNQKFNCTAVKFGESSTDEDCLNVRAQVYAGKDGVNNWIKQGGALEPAAEWLELNRIRYRKNASSKTVLEPKDEMIKDGRESPDVADALALTFAECQDDTYYQREDSPYDVLSHHSVIKSLYPNMPG